MSRPPRSALDALNPRYAAFCRAHGAASKDEMMALDRHHLVNFMFWIQTRWREWHAETGKPQRDFKSKQDHIEFDTWLQAKTR